MVFRVLCYNLVPRVPWLFGQRGSRQESLSVNRSFYHQKTWYSALSALAWVQNGEGNGYQSFFIVISSSCFCYTKKMFVIGCNNFREFQNFCKGKETLFIHGNNFKAVSLWGRVGEMLAFEERGKPEYPEKNLSEQGREPTNSAHIWHRGRGERGKPEYPEKNLSEQGREPTNSAHMRYRGERGKPEYPEKNLSQQGREPTNSAHMRPNRRIEPGPHWWEASALTTTPSVLPKNFRAFLGVILACEARELHTP